MARSRTTRPELAEHKPYLEGVAKNLAGKLFGPDGMPWGTTFENIEELSAQMGQTVSRELLNYLIRQQAAKALPTEAELCPTCQNPSAVVDPEPRIVSTGVGDAEWSEPQRHCRHCRRSFFPSVPELGHRPRGPVANGVA